jgi:hypothetical protein
VTINSIRVMVYNYNLILLFGLSCYCFIYSRIKDSKKDSYFILKITTMSSMLLFTM